MGKYPNDLGSPNHNMNTMNTMNSSKAKEVGEETAMNTINSIDSMNCINTMNTLLISRVKSGAGIVWSRLSQTLFAQTTTMTNQRDSV